MSAGRAAKAQSRVGSRTRREESTKVAMGEGVGFDVAVRRTPDGVDVVSVAGELDLLGATKLHRPLMDAVSGPVTVLDLGGCTFCDSSGLRTVLQAWQRAQSEGNAFRMAGVGTSVVRVLETAGLLAEMELYSDVESALKA